MDTLSHLALGVVVAHACAGKRNRGVVPLLYGAAAAQIPDLDVLLTPFTDGLSALLSHRALSHSLLLWLIVPPLLALASTAIHRDANFTWKRRYAIISAAWLSHLVVDLFNTYGTAYLYPFSPHRFAIDALPILTLSLLLVLLALAICIGIWRKRQGCAPAWMGWGGIALVAVYLTTAVCAKTTIERQLSARFANMPLYTSPLPISIARWHFVADAGDHYIVGRCNPLGKQIAVAAELPKNHHLLAPIANCPKIGEIQRFTKDWFDVQSTTNGQLLLHDLRFSSMATTYPDAYVLTFSTIPDPAHPLIERSKLRRNIGFGF